MVLLSNFGKREVKCSFKKQNFLGWKYKFQSMVKIAGTSHFFFFSVASCDLEAGIRMALLIRGCGLSILGNYCTYVTHLHICTLWNICTLHTAHLWHICKYQLQHLLLHQSCSKSSRWQTNYWQWGVSCADLENDWTNSIGILQKTPSVIIHAHTGSLKHLTNLKL